MSSSKPRRIVYCTPALYSAGGVERVVSVKANYLADYKGYDVTIIVTEGNGRESFFFLSEKVKVINLQIGFEELWHVPFLKKIILYIQKQYKYKKLLRAELMRIRPDITISTLRREINFLTDIKYGGIKIGELHVNRTSYRDINKRNANFIKKFFTYYWKLDLIRHLKKLDKMVVLTDYALNDWPELDNVVKIPDPLPFSISTRSNLLYRRIISIGHYTYDKGNDLLLKVWAKIEKQIPDWSLDIYGNGNRIPYQEMVKQLHIDISRCHLYESISDVKQAYLSGSIFALSSRFEGFGLVLIEAMACGMPVISFDCDNGPRSIISDGVNGFLISAFDIDSYANKLMLLMQDQTLRNIMGTNAIESSKQYDIDKIGVQWIQLFDDLMVQNGV